MSSLQAFFNNNGIRKGRLHKVYFPLIKCHFQQEIAWYEVDDEGIFWLKYVPSGFEKIGVPQMNICIYKDHAFLITNLESDNTMRLPSDK